jgi:hypothetical protein
MLTKFSSFPRIVLPSQHLCQAGETAAIRHEVVRQQFICSGSAFDIDTKTDAKECLELSAELVWVLQSRRAVGGDQEESFQGFFIQVRWFGFDHLNSHDAERPNIDLGTVFLLFDHFWRHPVGSAHHGCTLRLGLGKLGAETKIG